MSTLDRVREAGMEKHLRRVHALGCSCGEEECFLGWIEHLFSTVKNPQEFLDATTELDKSVDVEQADDDLQELYEEHAHPLAVLFDKINDVIEKSGASDGMLRIDLATGEVVQVDDFSETVPPDATIH